MNVIEITKKDSNCDEKADNCSTMVAKWQNYDKTTRYDSDCVDKKVTFNLRPTVHMMCVWQFAYLEARKSNWEQIGRDRARFLRRVMNLTGKLSTIFDVELRKKIYNQRFRDE